MARELSDNRTLRIRCIRETGRLPALFALFDDDDKTDPEIIEWIQNKTDDEYDVLLNALNKVNTALFEDYKQHKRPKK